MSDKKDMYCGIHDDPETFEGHPVVRYEDIVGHITLQLAGLNSDDIRMKIKSPCGGNKPRLKDINQGMNARFKAARQYANQAMKKICKECVHFTMCKDSKEFAKQIAAQRLKKDPYKCAYCRCGLSISLANQLPELFSGRRLMARKYDSRILNAMSIKITRMGKSKKRLIRKLEKYYDKYHHHRVHAVHYKTVAHAVIKERDELKNEVRKIYNQYEGAITIDTRSIQQTQADHIKKLEIARSSD